MPRVDKLKILPGHAPDYSSCTFVLEEEDHTIGNALRYIIMKNPQVEFCGYSAPHPSDYKINFRIQMFQTMLPGEERQSAVDAFRKGLQDLDDLFAVVSEKYSASMEADEYERFDSNPPIDWERVKEIGQANKDARAAEDHR